MKTSTKRAEINRRQYDDTKLWVDELYKGSKTILGEESVEH